jgi:hypothetical protein
MTTGWQRSRARLAGELGDQQRGPRAGAHDDRVGGEQGRARQRAVVDDAVDRAVAQDGDAGGDRLDQQVGDDGAGLGPAALAVEVAVDVHPGAVGREPRGDRGGVEPFDAMAAAGEQGEAVVLELAGPHRGAGEERDAGLVEPGDRPGGVPPAPAVEGALAEQGVILVGAVVAADDLADVGGLGERVGERAGIDEGDLARAGMELEGGGDAEDAAADDENAHGANLEQRDGDRESWSSHARRATAMRRGRPRQAWRDGTIGAVRHRCDGRLSHGAPCRNREQVGWATRGARTIEYSCRPCALVNWWSGSRSQRLVARRRRR